MPRFVLLVLAALVLLVQPALAQDKTIVALLPLDAEARLGIYGQPVAAEIAKALAGTEITLIVVGSKMTIPPEAALIVDGTIKHDKGTNKVELALRIRRKSDGSIVVVGPSSDATGLQNIDKAAADLSQKLLVDLRKLHEERTTVVPVEPPPPQPIEPTPITPAGRPTLVAIVASDRAHAGLRSHLATELTSAMTRVRRVGEEVAPQKMSQAVVVKTVRDSGHDLGVLLEVTAYVVTPGSVPLAQARIHVRVVDRERILFDRFIVTDSVVGDKDMAADALAQRTAREVITILGPHLKRTVPAWQ